MARRSSPLPPSVDTTVVEREAAATVGAGKTPASKKRVKRKSVKKKTVRKKVAVKREETVSTPTLAAARAIRGPGIGPAALVIPPGYGIQSSKPMAATATGQGSEGDSDSTTLPDREAASSRPLAVPAATQRLPYWKERREQPAPSTTTEGLPPAVATVNDATVMEERRAIEGPARGDFSAEIRKALQQQRGGDDRSEEDPRQRLIRRFAADMIGESDNEPGDPE